MSNLSKSGLGPDFALYDRVQMRDTQFRGIIVGLAQAGTVSMYIVRLDKPVEDALAVSCPNVCLERI